MVKKNSISMRMRSRSRRMRRVKSRKHLRRYHGGVITHKVRSTYRGRAMLNASKRSQIEGEIARQKKQEEVELKKQEEELVKKEKAVKKKQEADFEYDLQKHVPRHLHDFLRYENPRVSVRKAKTLRLRKAKSAATRKIKRNYSRA